MSILINMKMPKNCRTCPMLFDGHNYRWCNITGESLGIEETDNGRDEYCPLIELPPHGRLGDLDKLMQEFMDSDLDHLQRDDWREIIQIVSDAEVVIEAEGNE